MVVCIFQDLPPAVTVRRSKALSASTDVGLPSDGDLRWCPSCVDVPINEIRPLAHKKRRSSRRRCLLMLEKASIADLSFIVIVLHAWSTASLTRNLEFDGCFGNPWQNVTENSRFHRIFTSAPSVWLNLMQVRIFARDFGKYQ